MLYSVRRGDTLITIADRFGVSLAQLRRWNKLTGIRVRPGSRLRVAEPPVTSHRYRHHRGRKSATKRAAPPAANQHAASRAVPPGKRSAHTTAGSASRKSRTRRAKHASKQN
jgi:membrane-bound lytic murein transglycosylase D